MFIPTVKDFSFMQPTPAVPAISQKFRKYQNTPLRPLEWSGRHTSLNPPFYLRERVVRIAQEAFSILSCLCFTAAAATCTYVATPIATIAGVGLCVSGALFAIVSFVCHRKKEFLEDPEYRIKLGKQVALCIQKLSLALPEIEKQYGALITKYNILTEDDVNRILQLDVMRLDYDAFLKKHGPSVFELLDAQNLELMKAKFLSDSRKNGLGISCKDFPILHEKFKSLKISPEDINNQLRMDIHKGSVRKVLEHHGETLFSYMDNATFNFLRDNFIWHVQYIYEKGVHDFLATHGDICQQLQIDKDSQIAMVLTSQCNNLFFRWISYEDFWKNNGDYILTLDYRKYNLEQIFFETLRKGENLGLQQVKEKYAKHIDFYQTSDDDLGQIVLPRQVEALHKMGYVQFKKNNGEKAVKQYSKQLKPFFFVSFSMADFPNCEAGFKALAEDCKLLEISYDEFKQKANEAGRKKFIDMCVAAPAGEVLDLLESHDIKALEIDPAMVIYHRWKDRTFKAIFADHEEKDLFEKHLQTKLLKPTAWSRKIYEEILSYLQKAHPEELPTGNFNEAQTLFKKGCKLLVESHKADLQKKMEEMQITLAADAILSS